MAEVLNRRRLPREPVIGLTIRYAYLWYREYSELRRREGLKDRPCLIVSTYEAYAKAPGRFVTDVAPISHAPGEAAVEIPLVVKKRMGLDPAPSWIATTEINRFLWPGPDIRPVRYADNREEMIWHWGVMAVDVFNKAREKILVRRADGSLLVAPRAGR